MKKIIITLCLLLPLAVLAQDIQEINKLIQYRRYPSAEVKAKALVNADRSNGQNLFWLTQVYVAAKDSAALLSLDIPTSEDSWFRIATANKLLFKGDAVAARSLFDAALGNSRKKDPALMAEIARSNIYNNNGDRQYAIDLLEQTIKKDKHNPELYTMMGDAWFRLRNGSEAFKAYQKALEINNAYAPASFQVGKIFATQDNREMFLKYYNDAVAADPAFAPAWYELSYQHWTKDRSKALEYYNKYLAVTDVNEQDEYQLADLLYLNKRYDEALNKATVLLKKPGAQNRLNKLVAYIYKAKNDFDQSLNYMNVYLSNGADSNFIVEDYSFVADIYEQKKEPAKAAEWYEKTIPMLKDSAEIYSYYKKLSDFYKEQKEYEQQVPWVEKYYTQSGKGTNVDLFNWGFALYMSKDYTKADSVFNVYSNKYPEDVYGPYWQARSMVAIDTAMAEGLAIPYYEKLIAVAGKDTSKALNKKYLAEAYGYIAAYVANEKKDYDMAIDYFEKLLEVDPANNEAKKYIEVLEKMNSRTSAAN